MSAKVDSHDVDSAVGIGGAADASLLSPLLPQPSRSSLRGLDKVFSQRFSDDGGEAGGDDGSTRRAPNIDDLLRAQRALKFLKRAGGLRSVTNQSSSNDNDTETQNLVHELEAVDEDGHVAHGHTPWRRFYDPPVQRQRWGEDQVLPHVNWGDLLFDLFYVGAAYNMGALVTSALTSEYWLRGLIYYLGTFGPLWNTWEVSMFHESRYTNVDVAHRVFEVFRQALVGLSICFITPIKMLGDPKSLDSVLFLLALFLELLMQFVLCAELYFKGVGDREAIKTHTMVKIKVQLLPMLLMYLAALITAVVLLLQPEDVDAHKGGYDKPHEKDRLLAAPAPTPDDDHGYESAAEPLWKVSDLPLTLMAISYLLNNVATFWHKRRVNAGKSRQSLRNVFVPYNVDYAIHRYGEWTMLMLGEGILSLLIVETVFSRTYDLIIVFGIFTMICIGVLKFATEPFHGDEHAMWRNVNNSWCYGILIQILSLALIAFGVSYKNFLYNVVNEVGDYKPHEGGASGQVRRFLAAVAFTPASEGWTADVFCFGLAIVMLSLELMTLTHAGLKKEVGHLAHWPIAVIALFRAAIILFTLTMQYWTSDPVVLTVCGCFMVMLLALARVTHLFHKPKVIQESVNMK